MKVAPLTSVPGSIDDGRSAVKSLAENANGTSKPPGVRTVINWKSIPPFSVNVPESISP